MKKCEVCGREVAYLTRGMCNKHYHQYKKYGKVLDNNPRTKNDPNEIVLYEDYAEIVLYNICCEEIARAQIDIEDIEKVRSYKWYLGTNGYVSSKGVATNNEMLYLHRLVMDCYDELIVDHQDHCPLNNRKSNLRICTQHENTMNQGKKNTSTLEVTGVFFRNNKWEARIMFNYRNVYLGRFNTKEEAIQARKNAEIEYFGEYRNKDEDAS